MLGLFIAYLILHSIYSFYVVYRKSSKLVSYLLWNPIYDLECGDSLCDCRYYGVCSRYTGYVLGLSKSDRTLILGQVSDRWIKA